MLAPIILFVILCAVFVTAFISGVFGMAGGIILMGVLTAVLTVAQAMILHGAVQLMSNGWRAFLWRRYIHWPAFRHYLIGTIVALAALSIIAWEPDKQAVYLMLGGIALLVWMPKTWLHLDITRPIHAVAAGFSINLINTLAGVAGALVDLFYANIEMDRRQVVATKSATVAVAHVIKIAFWSLPLFLAMKTTDGGGAGLALPWWIFPAIVPFSIVGTWLGGKVLERMTDVDFRRYTKWLITLAGAYYLMRGMI